MHKSYGLKFFCFVKEHVFIVLSCILCRSCDLLLNSIKQEHPDSNQQSNVNLTFLYSLLFILITVLKTYSG